MMGDIGPNNKKENSNMNAAIHSQFTLPSPLPTNRDVIDSDDDDLIDDNPNNHNIAI